MSVYLGFDVGTQSVKALCYDAEENRVVARASSELELISRDDGSREQIANWWLAAMQDCCSKMDARHRSAVVAIGVSGQQHGFVALGDDGSVLAPVKLWCDTSTNAECEQIMEAFGGAEKCLKQVGNPILPGYTASKIRWLKNHKPDSYQKLNTILLPHDYVNFWLTGEKSMEAGDASGTGLLDIRERQWHSKMLRALDPDRDLRECLPQLSGANDCSGRLREEAANALGLPAGIPVSAGGGDNMMAAIGTGNIAPGRMTISLGTSGTLFAYSDQPVVDEAGDLAAFCDSTGGWLPLLCTMNCTVSTEVTRAAHSISLSEIDQRVTDTPVGAGGVMTLPFFNGERTPNLPSAKASVFGLTESNYSANNLLRSAMESSIFGLKVGLTAFQSHGFDIDSVRLTGGGAQSLAWQQIVADVFDVSVSALSEQEAAAFGAAIQAQWMHSHECGRNEPLVSLCDASVHIEQQRAPCAEAADRYKNLYAQYLQHVDVIKNLYDPTESKLESD